MDQKFKEKWVKALRSGRYKQGTGRLRSDDNNFCCLGVAANIAGVPCEHNEDWSAYDYKFDENTLLFATIPNGWNGITYEEGDSLAKMNDNGATFEEIADYIEENL